MSTQCRAPKAAQLWTNASYTCHGESSHECCFFLFFELTVCAGETYKRTDKTRIAAYKKTVQTCMLFPQGRIPRNCWSIHRHSTAKTGVRRRQYSEWLGEDGGALRHTGTPWTHSAVRHGNDLRRLPVHWTLIYWAGDDTSNTSIGSAARNAPSDNRYVAVSEVQRCFADSDPPQSSACKTYFPPQHMLWCSEVYPGGII